MIYGLTVNIIPQYLLLVNRKSIFYIDIFKIMIYNIEYKGQSKRKTMKIKKPENFAVFGDSVGRGVIYNKESDSYETDRGFVMMLEEHLGIKAANFTRFGQTVDGGYAMLEKKLSKISGSDYVFLEFGGNDSDFDWKAIAEDPDAFHSPKTTLSEFIVIYKRMISLLRENSLTPIVLNLPPIDHELYFDRVSRDVNGDNILKWLGGDKKVIHDWHSTYSAAIYNICRENGVKMIDIRSEIPENELKNYVCPDGIHPNEEAHHLIFEKIISEFE